MNNDQQITHLDCRLDIIEGQNRRLMEMIYAKLQVKSVLLEETGGVKVLQIMQIQESSEGIVIRVK